MEARELDDEDLAAAIEEARQVAADTAADHLSQHDLAVLLLESYERHGDAAAVAEAADILRPAIADGGWSGLRAVLGSTLVGKYEIDDDGAALDEAIDLLSAVVRDGPTDPVTGTDHRIQLGRALGDRAWVTGSVADAGAAVALARSALADTAPDTVDHLVVRSNLSNALLTRYELTGGPDQVAEAVAHARAVAVAFPETDPRRASMFANLGNVLQPRALRLPTLGTNGLRQLR